MIRHLSALVEEPYFGVWLQTFLLPHLILHFLHTGTQLEVEFNVSIGVFGGTDNHLHIFIFKLQSQPLFFNLHLGDGERRVNAEHRDLVLGESGIYAHLHWFVEHLDVVAPNVTDSLLVCFRRCLPLGIAKAALRTFHVLSCPLVLVSMCISKCTPELFHFLLELLLRCQAMIPISLR